jgi:D-alanyl-lipoteichoic acid acyltransferase DltB (MBOAT superfamily)
VSVLLGAPFWLAALAGTVLMRLPWPARPMQRFGLLNALALAAVFGWLAALVAAALSLALWLALRRGGRPGPRVTAAVVVVAGLLFVAHKLHLEGQAAAAPLELLARLGWSYAFLRVCDAALAVRAGAPLRDPLTLLGFAFPFHMLVAGPIGSYRAHLAADDASLADDGLQALVAGLNLATTGLFFKLVVAEALRVFAFGLEGPLRSAGLRDSALLLVYLFFDFAGVSLAALGIGRLLGVPTPVNFDRPFLAASLTDFWQRWHASLGAWVRVHVFLPLQVRLVRAWGVRRAYAAGLLVLIASFGFVGAWHRFDARFLLWGLGMGAALALEKLLRDRLLRRDWARSPWVTRAWRVLGPAYVFAVITLSLHPLWEILL